MNRKALILFFMMVALFMPQQAYCDNIEEATTFYNDAIDLYENDQIEDSIELFEKAINLNPNFYEAHYNIAQILMSINKNDEALKSLEAIYKIKPDNTENLYNLGKIYFKKGYLSKAHEHLKNIPINSTQYESAKILIEKIEKRQEELSIENRIKEHQNVIDPQGKLKGIEIGEIQAPSGIGVDSRGNIYTASFSENQIYKISTFGQKTVFSKSNLIKGPIGIAIDKEDNIFVANYIANNIIKISPNGVASIFSDIKKPYCLNYDAKNNRLYVTEQETNKLVKFDL